MRLPVAELVWLDGRNHVGRAPLSPDPDAETAAGVEIATATESPAAQQAPGAVQTGNGRSTTSGLPEL